MPGPFYCTSTNSSNISARSFNRTFATCPGHSRPTPPELFSRQGRLCFNRTFATCPGHSLIWIITMHEPIEDVSIAPLRHARAILLNSAFVRDRLSSFNRTFATCPGHSSLLETIFVKVPYEFQSHLCDMPGPFQANFDLQYGFVSHMFQSHLCDMPGPFSGDKSILIPLSTYRFQSHLCDMPGPFNTFGICQKDPRREVSIAPLRHARAIRSPELHAPERTDV